MTHDQSHIALNMKENEVPNYYQQEPQNNYTYEQENYNHNNQNHASYSIDI